MVSSPSSGTRGNWRNGARGFLVLLAALAAGCGKFGGRLGEGEALRFETRGEACLNRLPSQVERYSKGDLTGPEWSDTWGCFEASLGQFTQLVSGSSPEGYTARDMRAFASHYLITDREVSLDLVRAGLELKAGLLGGRPDVLAPAEVGRLRDLIRLASEESGRLIPLLQAAHRSRDPGDYLALTGALARTTEGIRGRFRFTGTHDLPLRTLTVLAEELATLFEWEIDSSLIPLVVALKAWVAGGSPDSVGPAEWPALLGLSGPLGGAAFSVLRVSRADLESEAAYAGFLSRTGASVARALARSGTEMPLPALEAFFERVPEEWRFSDDWRPERLARVVESAKALFLGGDSRRISPAGWRRFEETLLENGAPWIEAWRRYLRHGSWNREIHSLWNPLRRFLEALPARHGGAIEAGRFHALIDAWVASDEAEPLKRTFDSVTGVLLGRSAEGAGPRVWNDGVAHAIRIARAFTRVRDAARRLNDSDGWQHLGVTLSGTEAALSHWLEARGGSVGLEEIDAILDGVPESWLRIDREALKKTLRPVVNRVFEAPESGRMDVSSIQRLFGLMSKLANHQMVLERIFEVDGLDPAGVAPSVFVAEAGRFRESGGGAFDREVELLVRLARRVPPLFSGRDGQITFAVMNRLSKKQLSVLVSARLLIDRLLAGYSSLPGADRATLEDFTLLLDDADELGYALGLMTPRAAELAPKRFREADLFMPVSDGDGYLDADEAAVYVAFILSSKELSRRILDATEPVCHDPELGQDELGWGWMDIACFREVFYSQAGRFWDFFPAMVGFWRSQPVATRAEFVSVIERSTREHGYSESPIASHDVEAMTGIFQYVESLFLRFDGDRDGVIELDESLVVFEHFRPTLARLLDKDPDKRRLLRAVFTYLLKYGVPPRVNEGSWIRNIPGALHFLSWRARRAIWKIEADRMRVYEVLAALAAR